MSDINNYYAWLELPVESFESDPVKLASIVEKKLTEWQSHKKIDIQNRSNIHGSEIRRVINVPAEWEKIYLEFKDAVLEQIEDQLVFFINDGKITKEKVVDLAKSNKVSEGFVIKICDKNGYKLIEEKNKKTTIGFKLDDLKPASHLKIQPLQKTINELGEADLMSLISRQDIIGIVITESTPKDKVIEALDNMKKKWGPVPETGPKGTQKSHLGKIHAGFTALLKDKPFDDYIQYLKYNEAKSILNKIVSMGVKELNENAFNSTIIQLSEFTENADKAKGILVEFCSEKGIAYPVERKKISLCPFCSKSFEREEPMQQSCPVCGKSLLVKCPKCGNVKHLIMDSECDGINLSIYPFLEKKLNDIDKSCSALNINEAKERLNDLNRRWPGYPGAETAKEKIESLEKKYNEDLIKISNHLNKKEYFSVKAIVDKINGAFPGFKDNYGLAYSEIKNAEEAFSEAMKQSDEDKRLSLLLAINEFITDYSRLNIELGKYSVEPITELIAETDSDTGLVTLKWKSDNKPNSVFYSVRRKTDTIVSSKDEGIEITKTQGLSCSDKSIDEGKAYYYAVYAMRGTIESPLKSIEQPSILLKTPEISIIPGDGLLDLAWKSCSQKLHVFWSEKDINKYGDGNEITNASPVGVLLENLVNGTSYQIAAYKAVIFAGKEYRSKLAVFPKVVPVKPITPPKFSKTMGSKAGEYILVDEQKSEQLLEMYYSDTLVGITENKTISVFDMESKAKKLTTTKTSDGMYSVNMTDHKEMYVYPVYVNSGTLTVGNIILLTYVEPVKVSANVSGGTLCLSINKWPDGVDQITICYDNETYPQDITDCNRANRIPITKATYMKRPMLDIPNIKMQDYYITLFARKAGNIVPIGTTKYGISITRDIHYSISKSLFGGIKVTINNKENYRPSVTFVVGMGGIPLKKTGCVFSYDIPENTSATKTEMINIPKFHVSSNSYARLICEETGYRMIADGNVKLK